MNVFAYKEAYPKDKIKVLFPARILRDKGVYELIAAFVKLRPRYEQKAELILAGRCSDANKSALLEEELEESLIEGYISWIGFQKEIYPVYVDSDIVVLHSYREGVPKALIEACAVGRPIITTDVPGCRECVDDGVNGYLVPVKNSEKLANALEKLIISNGERKNMGLASRRKGRKGILY